MNISEIIKRIRWELRLSQQKLANELGCRQTCISSYELGQRSPNYSMLVKIQEFILRSGLDLKVL